MKYLRICTRAEAPMLGRVLSLLPVEFKVKKITPLEDTDLVDIKLGHPTLGYQEPFNMAVAGMIQEKDNKLKLTIEHDGQSLFFEEK